MRALVRLLVVIGLVLSGAALAPLTLASADPTDPATPSGAPSPSGSPSGAATGSSPSAQPSAPATTSSSADASPSASATPRKALARPSVAAEDDPTLQTTISSRPTNPTLDRTDTFKYEANRPGVRFHCTLTGPGQKGVLVDCPLDVTQTDVTKTTGAFTTANLKPSRVAYKLVVQAYVPAVVVAGKTTVPEVRGTTAAYSWRVFSLTRLDNYVPATGATFNKPMGTTTERRRNLTRMIRTINSMPGYLQGTGDKPAPCPSNPALVPATIRVSMYSMTDSSFANALVAAHHRCVSVKILMNNHLNSDTDPAWRTVSNGLGRTQAPAGIFPRRSWAHRCSFGCRGTGVMHTKMFLFDSTVPAPAGTWNKIKDTTFVGSSNMTSNAAHVQWNDLYGVRGNADLHGDFLDMFDRMAKDKTDKHLRVYSASGGKYVTSFWPQGTSADPEGKMLDSIKCNGATGGTGIGGHSLVYINMHAWFGTRGLGFANKVRGLYNRGCYVRVLYSFMSHAVFVKLHQGTTSRMVVRRTLFSKNGKTAYLYSHYKNIAVSGNVASSTASRVVWTGSNNFTNDGTHFDEVMMRISDAAAYAQYAKQWNYIKNTKSSPIYANFSEPTGGGRAPAPTQGVAANNALSSPTAPTITSPDVVVENGVPRALD